MSDTPRTREAIALSIEDNNEHAIPRLCYQLERELAEAQARIAEADDALREASKALTSQRVWGGMSWTYYPLRPMHYEKARLAVDAYWQRRQAEVDAAMKEEK